MQLRPNIKYNFTFMDLKLGNTILKRMYPEHVNHTHLMQLIDTRAKNSIILKSKKYDRNREIVVQKILRSIEKILLC